MLHGSCDCGAVKFALDGMPKMMGTCHCARCRKVGAAVFVIVEAKDFRWLEGSEFVTRYEPEGALHSRAFCARCGSSLGEAGGTGETYAIAANAFDDDPGVRNRFHEFVADKPEWLPIGDEAKQFPGAPSAG